MSVRDSVESIGTGNLIEIPLSKGTGYFKPLATTNREQDGNRAELGNVLGSGIRATG